MTDTAIADTDITDGLRADELAELLRGCGYRVAVAQGADGAPELRSAAQGLNFKVRFGPPEGRGGHVDFAFACPVAFEGEIPPQLAAQWNAGKRFARLAVIGPQVVLSMDVLLVGGVTTAHLRAQCELWDRLLQELVLFLHRPAATAAAAGT